MSPFLRAQYKLKVTASSTDAGNGASIFHRRAKKPLFLDHSYGFIVQLGYGLDDTQDPDFAFFINEGSKNDFSRDLLADRFHGVFGQRPFNRSRAHVRLREVPRNSGSGAANNPADNAAGNPANDAPRDSPFHSQWVSEVPSIFDAKFKRHFRFQNFFRDLHPPRSGGSC